MLAAHDSDVGSWLIVSLDKVAKALAGDGEIGKAIDLEAREAERQALQISLKA